MSAVAESSITSGPSTYEVQATSHPLIQAALARLSNEDRIVLTEFKEEFPNLIPEVMAKVANSFMLYRSLYVQKAKEQDPIGNQTDFSRDAAVHWKYNVEESEKARYTRWHYRVRAVWKKMYPNGFPCSAVIKKTKNKKKQDARVARKKGKKLTSSRPSSYKKFQPLPSPPVSDDADFCARTDAEEICDSMSEGDLNVDDEYLPENPSSQGNPCRSEPKQCLESELLTPVSMVRDLSPDLSFRCSSPTPAFSDSDVNIFLPRPTFGDIKLSELNGNCPSMFTNSLLFSSPSSNARYSQETGVFPEQTATGYSIDGNLETHSALITSDETNFLSDSEIYISLSSIPSPLCPDFLYADNFSISTDSMADALVQDLR